MKSDVTAIKSSPHSLSNLVHMAILDINNVLPTATAALLNKPLVTNGETTKTSITLNEKQIEMLDAAAEKTFMSRDGILRLLIHYCAITKVAEQS